MGYNYYMQYSITIPTGIPTESFTPVEAKAAILAMVKSFNTNKEPSHKVGLFPNSVASDGDWDDYSARLCVPSKEVLGCFLEYMEAGPQSLDEEDFQGALDEMWENRGRRER